MSLIWTAQTSNQVYIDSPKLEMLPAMCVFFFS